MGWDFLHIYALVAVLLMIMGAVAALRGRRAAAISLSAAGSVVLLAFVVGLWVVLERPPLRTMGETRLWYSFFLSVAGAVVYVLWRYRWILSFTTLLSTVFLCVNLFKPEIHSKSLMPALQSAWFLPHVAVYMFSYALLGVATLMSLYCLVQRNEELLSAVDNLLGGGLALFTVGMLTGALWAKQAWGEYWSWDAKEAWAAATWGLYLLAIHLPGRLNRARYGVIIVAFVALQMCWWGVNYLPSAQTSEHTYTQSRE